jgi:vitamin-K-epoxide reductase (warfarin-sensitive)
MRILRILIAVLALGGAFVSILALRIHMQDPNTAPPCAVTEKFDCGTVNHSRWAVFPPRGFDEDPNSPGHLPVAVAGIAGYLVIAALALFKRDFWTFEVSQVGVFLALGLTFVEKYILEKWCIYCLWSQGIMFTIFLLSVVILLLRRRHTMRTA